MLPPGQMRRKGSARRSVSGGGPNRERSESRGGGRGPAAATGGVLRELRRRETRAGTRPYGSMHRRAGEGNRGEEANTGCEKEDVGRARV
jgi:hypothetical protein